MYCNAITELIQIFSFKYERLEDTFLSLNSSNGKLIRIRIVLAVKQHPSIRKVQYYFEVLFYSYEFLVTL
jgi:hypothetical protein